MNNIIRAGVGIIAPRNVTLREIGYDPLRRGEGIVYRFLNRRGECIYIGYTASPLNRWQGHRAKPWWNEVHAIYYVSGIPKRRAREIEREDIREERPKYNRTVKHE